MKNIYLENIYLAMDPVCLGRFFIEKTLFGYLKRKMLNQLEVKAFAKKVGQQSRHKHGFKACLNIMECQHFSTPSKMFAFGIGIQCFPITIVSKAWTQGVILSIFWPREAIRYLTRLVKQWFYDCHQQSMWARPKQAVIKAQRIFKFISFTKKVGTFTSNSRVWSLQAFNK